MIMWAKIKAVICAMTMVVGGIGTVGMKAALAQSGGRIPLRIEPAPSAAKDYPVESGVPFRRGELKDAKNIRVLDSSGKEIPSQVREMVKWEDGSVKAALVMFQADIKKKDGAGYYVVNRETETRYILQYGRRISPKAVPAKPVIVKGAGSGTITVDTGVLAFKVKEKKFGLTDFSLDGKTVSPSVDLVLKANGKEFRASKTKAAKAVVEDSGPLVACIRLDGKHTAGDGSAYFDYVVRIYAYAGKPYIRVLYRIVNTDEKTGLESIEGWGWEMKVRGANKYAIAGDPGKVYSGAIRGDVHLFEGGNAWAATLSFSRPPPKRYPPKDQKLFYSGVGEGERARGWVDVSGASAGVTSVVRHFWQQYPKAIEVKPGLVNLWLHAPRPWNDVPFGSTVQIDEPVKMGYAIGFAKTHELFFNFHKGDMKAAKSEELAAVFQEKPFPKAPPARYCESGVFGPISATAGMEPGTNFIKKVDLIIEHMRIVVERVYRYGTCECNILGNYNFGETSIYTQVNHYFELPRIMATQFVLRDAYGTLKPCVPKNVSEKSLVEIHKDNKSTKFLFDMLEKACRHHMDIDVMHCNKAKGRHKDLGPGMHWGSRFGNRMGALRSISNHHMASPHDSPRIGNSPPAGGHPGGLYEYYMLTGDLFALETLKLQGDFFIALYKSGFKEKHHETQHAWPLWTLCDAYEATGEKKYLDGAVAITKFLIDWWNEPEDLYNGGVKVMTVDHPIAYWVTDMNTNWPSPCKQNPKCSGVMVLLSGILQTTVIRFRELNKFAKSEIDDKVLKQMIVETNNFIAYILNSGGKIRRPGGCFKSFTGCSIIRMVSWYPTAYAKMLTPGKDKAANMSWMKGINSRILKTGPPKYHPDGKISLSLFCHMNEKAAGHLWFLPQLLALLEKMEKEGGIK